MYTDLSLLKIYEKGFKESWLLPALSDYVTNETLTYGDFAKKIAKIHIVYKLCGIKCGDKVALLGKNTPEWVAVFMATLTYGAVIVPILREFNPVDAQHIVNHSDARLLFVDDSIYEHMDFDEMPKVEAVVSLETKKVLDQGANVPEKHSFRTAIREIPRYFQRIYPDGFSKRDIKYIDTKPDDVAVINYTSGTTGFSKGVMLTYRNLWGNVAFGIESRLHYQGSRALSFLPLAHAYGCAFDMLVPLAVGSHVTILGKTPTPNILVKALAKVKPSLVVCVPLILEKIYRKIILPKISTGPLKYAVKLPLVDKAVYSRIRKALIDTFGGEFEEVIVGGAPLNPEVEAFLHKIKFPFTVGYGMTECGPLISYTPYRKFIPTSSGHTLDGLMKARISKPEGDSNTNVGEIVVKGTNVMKGYYKNPEATKDVLESDGWLHTGDMGYLGGDDGQTIFIRGRYKTMILTATGQNIYPEEIEAKLNNMPFVAESLIVERKGRLTALVYPDMQELDQQGITTSTLATMMDGEIRKQLNSQLAPYEKIEHIQLVPKEFEKTPKRSIRRFLYN